jgi:CTP:molybdopterin cytidylyltransferase MocA
MTVVGIVLTAGQSARAGFPKALATLDGETLVARIGRTLREGGCDDVVYVVAAPHEANIRAALPSERCATNETPERGMLSSFQVGLRAATNETPESKTDAVVVALVDHPRVQAETIRLLLATWRETTATVVRPQHNERRGHPFVLACEEFTRALALDAADDTITMRDVIRGARDTRIVEVNDPYILDDLDDEAKLRTAGVSPPK